MRHSIAQCRWDDADHPPPAWAARGDAHQPDPAAAKHQRDTGHR
jgi:hypothetical protein